ncbi:hypothetical protein IscW_ISCW022568 [Ixodes scapularis]|uniref:Spaetzle domain-containing protein n=1 Tax=Ixodes scapularis TaxID=6945 RepID=B7QFC0_IXOSC|nr:hypothetical protein IscW_ISCW022568 [Ixodes scapularis]|eukprot:XP_002414234.1 hypothetical protein IscW_ISCW022568 [Ixodes scapularis]
MLLVVLCEIRGGGAQTRPHGYKVPRSGRMPPGPGRMQVPTGRPAQHPASPELRPYVDASGKPACNATGLRNSAYCVEDNTYPTQEDTPCEFLSSSLPPGYTSACRQKFAYRKLLALHPTDKKAYADNFPFPSCCVCYVKSPPLAARSLPRRT